MNEIQNKIVKFITQKYGFFDFPYNEETSLQYDLNLYGDDASDFLLSFSKEFDVKIAKFTFEDFFIEENHGCLFFFDRIFNKENSLPKSKKLIKLKHLENAIKIGVLDFENLE